MSLACRYRLEQCGAPQRLWGREYSPHTKKKKKKKAGRALYYLARVPKVRSAVPKMNVP